MIAWSCGCGKVHPGCIPVIARRWLSSSALKKRLSEPVQSYVATSQDPYLNLSIEHYILQKSSPESATLFLYVNRPSIIIGRNQNPWLEVNLALLKPATNKPETEPPGLGIVDLVRRRSGGGTVFHDEGNVNWSIICPSAQFTRDKHAEMVVRALRSCGVEEARVNERHDIVLDQGERVGDSDPDETHVTPYTKSDGAAPKPLKVSGSAYKLTRGRALHHGTCLLSSPNLNIIPDYLRSPARPFITARGVESVSSPVGNTLLSNEDFFAAVQQHFSRMYSGNEDISPDEVGEDLLEIDEVRRGYEELKSPEWTYLQTPQFEISSNADDTARLSVKLTVRHGVITAGSVSTCDSTSTGIAVREVDRAALGQKLHEIDLWQNVVASASEHSDPRDMMALKKWSQSTFHKIDA